MGAVNNIGIQAKKIIPFPIKLFMRRLIWKTLYGFHYALKIIKLGKINSKVICPISEEEFIDFVPMYLKQLRDLPAFLL